MNFREKNKYLRNLHAPNHAGKDIVLLEKVDPRNDMLDSFKHAPIRHAERILYILLDFATPDEIRNNRREIEILEEKERELKKEANRLKAEEAERLAAEEAEKKSPVETESSPSHPKQAPQSSKKKTSTRKSIGKTSKTKTSR